VAVLLKVLFFNILFFFYKNFLQKNKGAQTSFIGNTQVNPDKDCHPIGYPEGQP